MRDTHEVWRNIQESDNIYSVSNLGRVKNNETGNVLKPIYMHKGYMKVNLHLKNGRRIGRFIHRLVAAEFIPNPNNKPEVNHINGIHDDNRLVNLEWVTPEENRIHAYETGLVRHKDYRYGGYLYSVWLKWHKTDEWCSCWNDYLEFHEWGFENGYKDGLFLRRQNRFGRFEPDNCYFGTRPQYSAKRYKYKDGEYSISELAEISGYCVETLRYRLLQGMSIENAVDREKIQPGRPRKDAI